ncbi:hypothetical protein B0S90_2599 [Caldicellulosiruptor bescii]|uniref:Uncharacterized protein n=2 Tax=Caldicellulosiruptor bescii TaxID=31899 RepID=B9MMN6_CALBD|nr:hypothetical protein [Caldicellulosiruptor bescii]ACM61335.1 hypothetical protein Athe_2263 [Caldicellulosiruptor bescii DSM 6725]PBC88851.1 hypothetical protein B0S87_1892 [Caldicellulosiruptor bescii]PBC91667.1 hypothetical protein B0S89_2100 [Caldicellulosiruptor bescii]PBD02920.1 hypothetical protein B0S85_0472 [Caldicellulosiruptor bescii]PBD07463.1 hypothetical protein B0S90_2599 [Caldicellulosiruptor bescii]
MRNLLKNRLIEVIDNVSEGEFVGVVNFIKNLKFKDEKEENEILNDVELIAFNFTTSMIIFSVCFSTNLLLRCKPFSIIKIVNKFSL